MLMMIIPLSSFVLDSIIAVNMCFSVLLLIVAIYLKRPADFFTFPTVILIATAFRLSLSVSTTRSILSEGDGGDIIGAFGDFVVGGSVAVGLVMFAIITVVQFLVITKGAERVAEVTARFNLDALPGKQMAIDADVRAGSIEVADAVRLRKALQLESQFFGSMDGAMKFVKGDAIAGIIIIFINLIGGISIGVTTMDLGFSEAVTKFSLLTIGDGLVSQIPALMIAMCSGIVVTRISDDSESDLGIDIHKQLISDRKVLFATAAVAFLLGLLPGFPTVIFWVVSGLLIFAALSIPVVSKLVAAKGPVGLESQNLPADRTEGNGIPNPNNAGALGEPIDGLLADNSNRFLVYISGIEAAGFSRREFQIHLHRLCKNRCISLGVEIPLPDVIERADPGGLAVVVVLDDVPIFKVEMAATRVLVPDFDFLNSSERIPDKDFETLDWIDFKGAAVESKHRGALNAVGAVIANLETTLANQVFRLYERNLGVLFGRAELVKLTDRFAQLDPASTKSIQAELSNSNLLEIFRQMVEDAAPVRPHALFAEALSHLVESRSGASPQVIVELLRVALRRQLTHSVLGTTGVIGIALVGPRLEELARRGLTYANQTGGLFNNEGLVFSADIVDSVVGEFRAVEKLSRQSEDSLVVVVNSDLRRRLRNFLASYDIHIPVLAPHELSQDVTTVPIKLIELPSRTSVGAGYNDADLAFDTEYSN